MSSKRTVLIAGLFGNALEWYDFILFANFASIIATLFFPSSDSMTALLLTFAVFATGFLVRPIGAILFGYIGDHLGRRTALITSISIITLPTLFIGLLPTYSSIGLAAPVLLTLLRILQGIAISGEMNSAATYLVEHAKKNRRGLAGSLVMCSAITGILTGAVMSYLMTTFLATDSLYSWGWRLPFWFSGVLGIAGLIVRLRTKESPKFLQKITHEIQSPLKRVFIHFRKELLLSFFLTSVMAVGNYIFLAYIMTYLVKSLHFSMHAASVINLAGLVMTVITIPCMGLLSDKIGRKPVFKAGLYGIFIMAMPIFWLYTQNQFIYALAGNMIFGLILAPIAALIPTLLAELFPTHVRNSGTTIGYNLCLAIFGGTAPLVSLSLVDISGSDYAPGIYMMLCALISFAALRYIDDKHKETLE